MITHRQNAPPNYIVKFIQFPEL